MTLPFKHLFDLPEGVIYLDGNSLGPLPRAAPERALRTISDEWGGDLIKAWNSAGWMDLPRVVGDRIAALLGAPAGSVATGDTLSIKVFQALAAALRMRPDRRVILSDAGNFPTDLYMAQGLIDTIGKGHELRTPDPQDVAGAISDEAAVVMLTQVDYRSGRMHDMAAITRAAPTTKLTIKATRTARPRNNRASTSCSRPCRPLRRSHHTNSPAATTATGYSQRRSRVPPVS